MESKSESMYDFPFVSLAGSAVQRALLNNMMHSSERSIIEVYKIMIDFSERKLKGDPFHFHRSFLFESNRNSPRLQKVNFYITITNYYQPRVETLKLIETGFRTEYNLKLQDLTNIDAYFQRVCENYLKAIKEVSSSKAFPFCISKARAKEQLIKRCLDLLEYWKEKVYPIQPRARQVRPQSRKDIKLVAAKPSQHTT